MTDDTQQPTSNPESASESIVPLEARIAELETALATERDNALRKAAEFDNIRKRLVADSKRQSEAGKLGFIQQVLAVADTLEVALTTPSDKDTVEHVRQGVELTLNKLRQLLGEHGVTRYDSLGEPFDPDRHEALSMGRNPDLPDQAVIQVLREGYARGDHILRHAQVIINNLN
ncbi:MAG TPA: nucleotide exchange factor GrpE [Opitutaceae bacterium]